MSDMIRNAIGAIVFTAAALFFINYVGNMTTNANHTEITQKIQKAEVVDIKQAPIVAAPSKAAPEPKAGAPKAVVEAAAKAPAKAEARVMDADKGYKAFKRKCLGCHTVNKGAPNRTGPNLWGIVDRAKGAKDGFRYSKSLKTYGGTWTEADLSRFIAGPRVMIRDTKMTFRGIKTEADRLDIIAFMKTLKD